MRVLDLVGVTLWAQVMLVVEAIAAGVGYTFLASVACRVGPRVFLGFFLVSTNTFQLIPSFSGAHGHPKIVSPS